MKLIKTIIFSFCIINSCWAHKDFYAIKVFGNVTVRFKTGFQYEEIQKAFMIGQYCNLYLNYNFKTDKEVLLDFEHCYTGECVPNYFVNYSRGEWTHKYNDYQSFQVEPYLKKEGIVIKQVAHKFNVYETLKLLKYSLANLVNIRLQQKIIVYNQNYSTDELKTIDTLITKWIIREPLTPDLKNIVSLRVYRIDNYEGINYFSSQGKFGAERIKHAVYL